MICKLFLIALIFAQNAHCSQGNFLNGYSETVKELLTKWETKELDLSTGCGLQLTELLQNMITLDDGLWAYKMIDATGKFPAGLAEGNEVLLGDFNECLDVVSEIKKIKGNFCAVTLDISAIETISDNQTRAELLLYKLLKRMQQKDIGNEEPFATMFLYGLCVPDKCTADDVTNAISHVTKLTPYEMNCQTEDDRIPALDTGAKVILGVFGLIIVFIAASTLMDCTWQKRGVKAHPLLISFSIYTNGQKLFGLRRSQGEISCIDGIRFLSTCWVILGNVFISNLFEPTANLFEMLRYTGKTESMIYLNAHAIDTFFVLSGLLVSYNFTRKRRKGESFNIFRYYIRRYLRLTIPYGVVILCSIYLLKYLGSGPIYYKINIVSQLCRDNWWKNLIYLQNYLGTTEDLCVSQSWYLAIDFQLYVLSPIFLLCLYKTPRFGTLMIILSIIGCMLAGFFTTYQEHLSTMIISRNTTEFLTYYYFKTHTRASTWFIGLLLGFVLGRIRFHNDNMYLRVPKVITYFIWLAVLALIPFCVYGFHDTLTQEDYDVVANSLYNTFTRPVWALCVSWIIYACATGRGGIVNNILSLPIFRVLSKFTYSVYLIHVLILYIMICARKNPTYFSVAGLIDEFSSILVISFVLAAFWTLAFETPILVIESHISGPALPKSKQQVTNTITENGSYKNEIYFEVKDGKPYGHLLD